MRLAYEPLENEEIRDILPAEMTFVFELSKEECHLLFTGVCSLDRAFSYKSKTIRGDADYHHCRKILKSIRKEGIIELIDLIKYSCGHYGFNDGQHRVCIAKRKDIVLKAIVGTNTDACRVCRDESGKNTKLS